MVEEQPQQVSSGNQGNAKWWVLFIGGGCALIACAGLIVALAILGPWTGRTFSEISLGPSSTPAPTQASAQATDTHLNEKANFMGNPNAPVNIIEYADFQCPYCLHYWQDTEPQIIQTYVATGKVYYEYRSVGAFIGQESAAAAEAAYCAGDQGKFWEYHDTLFSHWTGENAGDFTVTKLQQYAAALGLDQTKFSICLKNEYHAAQIQQDVADARSAGIRATPSFLINGKLLEGAQPFDAFQTVIEAALKGK